MVNIREITNPLLKYFAASLFSILIVNVSFATPQLLTVPDKITTEIGRPIKLELIGISLDSKLTEMNLSALNKNFGVVTDYFISDTTDRRWPNESIQILKLKIYPRATGELVIPALSFNNVHSKKITITSLSGNIGIPQIKLSVHEPSIRQQIILQVTITSADLTARLSINKNDSIKGYDSNVLPFSRVRKKDGLYQLQTGWALTALRSGLQTLELPAIDYSESGVSRKKLYLPTIVFNIKPLPLYLPPTIPVGEINIQSVILDRSFIMTNTLSYWDLKVTGPVTNTYQLPPVLRQIKSNNEMSFLPANTTRTVTALDNSLVSSVSYSIPFKALSNGVLSLPTIQLQYFEPETGTIKTVTHKPQTILVLSLFFRNLIILVITGFAVWGFSLIVKKWKKIKYTQLKYQQALELLKNQQDVTSIRESIRIVAEAEYWSINLTITQWCSLWSQTYKTDTNFKSFCTTLSDLFYQAKNQQNHKALSEKLIFQIEHRARL